MIRNTLLGTRVRVCIYYSKVKCRQGYCVAIMFISRFSDSCYFLSYTGHPHFDTHCTLGHRKRAYCFCSGCHFVPSLMSQLYRNSALTLVSDDPVHCSTTLCAVSSVAVPLKLCDTTIANESPQCDALLEVIGLRLGILTQN